LFEPSKNNIRGFKEETISSECYALIPVSFGNIEKLKGNVRARKSWKFPVFSGHTEGLCGGLGRDFRLESRKISLGNSLVDFQWESLGDLSTF